jgi:hypothetical protein
MNNSPIGALPVEVREMIYENFFEGDFFRISLVPLTLCEQMKAEATKTLVRIPKTAIVECGNVSSRALTAPNFNQLRALAQRFSAIPQALKSRLTFEVQHDCRLLGSTPLLGNFALPTVVSNAQFTRDIRNLVATVSPCNVVISVNFTFNSLSGSNPSSSSYHAADRGRLSNVCPKGDPVSPQECEQILVKISAVDKIQAQKAIDEAFAAKCSQFEAHRAHRVCFIRLGIDQALQNLVDARDMMTEMVDLL